LCLDNGASDFVKVKKCDLDFQGKRDGIFGAAKKNPTLVVDTKYLYKLAAFCLDDGFEQNFPRCQLNYLGSFNPTRMFLVIFFFRQKLLELL
jgi:hypothetical protein